MSTVDNNHVVVSTESEVVFDLDSSQITERIASLVSKEGMDISGDKDVEAKLEKELSSSYTTPEQQKKLKYLITQYVKNNSIKTEQYRGVRRKPRESRAKTVRKKKDRRSYKRAPIDTEVFSLTPALRNIVGVEKGKKSEINDLLWNYIKENQLQNEKDRREIICDDLLKELCDGNDKVFALVVTKYLNLNLIRVEPPPKPPKKEESSEDEEDNTPQKKISSYSLGSDTDTEEEIFH